MCPRRPRERRSGRWKSTWSPEGANSVQAAAAADHTWGGSVDDGRLESVDNVGPRRLWGGMYTAADFHFRFVKRLPG